MGFAGELTTIGLSEVFQNVAFNRLTGVLTVTERGRRAAVYLDDGMIRAFRPDADRTLDYVAIAERHHVAASQAVRDAAVLEQAGEITQFEVRDTQLSLTEARTNLSQAQHAYNVALFALERAVGVPLGPLSREE